MLFLCPANYHLAHSRLASLPASSGDRISRRRIWPAVRSLVCQVHFNRKSNASRVVWFEAPVSTLAHCFPRLRNLSSFWAIVWPGDFQEGCCASKWAQQYGTILDLVTHAMPISTAYYMDVWRPAVRFGRNARHNGRLRMSTRLASASAQSHLPASPRQQGSSLG